MHTTLQFCTQIYNQVRELPSPLSLCTLFYLFAGPQGVSELRYRSNDSTALWLSSTLSQEGVSFLYELSLENGPTVQSNRVTNSELHLSGLKEGKTYVLDVWEECEGEWESVRSRLCFEGANSTTGILVRAAESAANPGQCEEQSVLLQGTRT